MPRSKYRRPELVLYKDPAVGGCASDQVSAAECMCDCNSSECDTVGANPPTGCLSDTGSCNRCTDGSAC